MDGSVRVRRQRAPAAPRKYAHIPYETVGNRPMKTLSTLLAAAAFVLAGTSSVVAQETRIATFAGGCFWCIESDFDKVPGVLKTISGYTGGKTLNHFIHFVTFVFTLACVLTK